MSTEILVENTPVYVGRPGLESRGGIIVIHEVWGLVDHIKQVADRFAKEGYLVYAPDLLKDMGIEKKVTPELQKDLFDPEKRNAAQPKLRELMAPIQSPEFGYKTTESLKKVFSALLNETDSKGKVAVVGYCFGGTYSYNLAVDEPRLAAAVPYYGHCDHSVDELRQITCPILAFYGEKDETLMASLPELKNRMHEAEVDFTAEVYGGTGHAFFNDTNPFSYKREAAADSWEKTLAFLSQHVG
jgi:carboxymethylenebutenolidase